VTGITGLPVTSLVYCFCPSLTTKEEIDMFGGLAAGFAHLIKPSNSAQGVPSDKRKSR
jgi:hypothetical protein